MSGYKHRPIPPDSIMTIEELRKKGYLMDESQWLQVGITRSSIYTGAEASPLSVSSFWKASLASRVWLPLLSVISGVYAS